MRRLARTGSSIAAVLVMIVASIASPAAATELSLVFTSTMADIEPVENEGGLVNLATFLRARRGEGPTLFLHGGASLAAGVLSSFDKGAHMIDLLNDLQPDMMAVTKRDLAFGTDELTLRGYEARFPLLSANAIDRRTGKVLEGLEPSLLIDTVVGRIGVVAVTSPELTVQYIVPDIQVLPPSDAAAVARSLRGKGAEFVVAVVDNTPEVIEELRREPAIDLLVQLAASGKDSLEVADGRGFGVHSNVKGTAFLMRLEREGAGRPVLARGEIVKLAGVPADPEMTTRVDVYRKRLSDLLDIKVGVTATPLDTRREAVRSGENAFASFIADTMRMVLGTDVALFNGGNIRGNRQYAPDTVLTRRDIQRELPFRDIITRTRLKGGALREALEVSAAGVETLKGGFLHVSNMEVVYDLKQPAGSRVVSVKVGGKPLDPEAEYSVGLPSYLAQGGDGYAMLKRSGPPSPAENAKLLWEIMAQRLGDLGTIAPRLDGRITMR
ncbi:bifunctional metallophosphatase/5'-nucleotidase [Azospirillum thermophilum]|nr:5'-nucleotidase C-terminal domain-containing protein [Azospirillum thermophilum]